MCCRLRPCACVSQVGKALAAIALLLIVAGETPGGRKVQWWTHKRAVRIQRVLQSTLQRSAGADTKAGLQQSSPGGITVSPSMRFNLTGQSMKRVAGATGDWLQTRINEALQPCASSPRSLRRKGSSSSTSSVVAASPKGAVLSRGASVDPTDATSPPTCDKETVPSGGAAEASESALGRRTTVQFSVPACAAGAAVATGDAKRRRSAVRAPGLLQAVRHRSTGAVRRTIASAVATKGRGADDEATLSPEEDEGEDEDESGDEDKGEAEAEGVDGDDVKAGGKVDGPISLRGAAVSLTVYAALQRNVAERRKQTQERGVVERDTLLRAQVQFDARAAERCAANFVSNLQRASNLMHPACNPMHPACSSMHPTTTQCVQARRVCREPEASL